MTRYALTIILFGGLLLCCEYQTDKVYFRELDNNPEAPVITNHLLDLETDTIHIFLGNTEFSFDFSSSDQDISLIRILLNNNEYLQTEDSSRSFTLFFSDLADGQNNLTLELYTQTGTGSIAEKTGYEAFFFKRDYVLVKHGSFDEVLTSKVNNGMLNLNWTNYPINSMDFDTYILYRVTSGGEVFKLLETKSTLYTDSTYVGESTEYRLKVRKKNGTEIYWGDEHLEQDFPSLAYQPVNDSTLKVAWSRPTYYNAIKNYQLTYRIPREYVDTEMNVAKEDTSLLIQNLFFGDECPLDFHIIPSGDNPQLEVNSDRLKQNITLKAITELPNFIRQKHNNGVWGKVGPKEIVFRSSQGELLRYDVEQLDFTQIIKPDYDYSASSLVFSESGNFATAKSFYGNDYLLINSRTFGLNAKHDLRNITGLYYSPSIIPSDDGLVLVPRHGGGFVIYDMWKDKTIASASFPVGLNLSLGAKYLWVRDEVLKLVMRTKSSYTTMYQSSDGYGDECWFHSVDSNLVIIQANNSINVYCLNPFEMKHKIELGSARIIDFDFHNNEVLLFQEGWLKVIDFLTSKELYKVHVPNSYFQDWAMYHSKTMLIDHKIIRKPAEMYDLTLSK